MANDEATAQPPGAPSGEPGAAQPDKSGGSKAGRNLPVAIAVGVVLGAVVLGSLIWVKWIFLIVAVLALWIGVVEVTRAMAQRQIRITKEPLLLALPIMAAVAYFFGPVAHLTAFAALVLVIMLFRLRLGIENYVRDTTASVFLAAYLPLMLGFAVLTLAADQGPALIATFIILTVGSDIGGYIAGVLFGKHPMAKGISPKKSWEGFAGSVLMQVVLGVLCFVFLIDAPAWQGAVMGLVMTFTATAGDFIESAVKRDLGVKDMGDIVPGHGGLMDRLDSLIPNAFVSWAFFVLFLGI